MKKMPLFIALLLVPFCHSCAQNFAWARSLQITPTDGYGQGITYDDSGNVYSIGSFSGTTDFDPGPGVFNLTSTGSYYSLFVLKLNQSGNFIWAKSINVPGSTYGSIYGNAIKIDKTGNIIVGGQFSGTIDYDPGAGNYNLSSVGNYDGFILKLDASGNFIWARSFGGTTYDYVLGVAIDDNDNVLATGMFGDVVDFDPGTAVHNMTSVGGFDIFVLKLNSSGILSWSKQLGGINNQYGKEICVDHSGGVYTTGYFTDSCDFDPGTAVYNLVSSGDIDIFVSKLDSSGNFVWAKRIGGSGFDMGIDIAVDSNYNVYTTGVYHGNVDFDPGIGSFVLYPGIYVDPAFICKLDSVGNFQWAKQIAGASSSRSVPCSIALDTFANVYTCGEFQGTVDFDPGSATCNITSTYPGADIFFSKLDKSGNFISAISLGRNGTDVASRIKVDKTGNIYLVGEFADTVDFDPGPGVFDLACPTTNAYTFIEKFTQCLAKPTITITTHPGGIIFSGQTDTFTTVVTAGGTSPHYQWYINSVVISGATNSMYISNTLADNDSVKCTVLSSDTCVATPMSEHTVVVHVISEVADVESPRGFKLFPNPNSGVFSINATGFNNEKVKLVISDLLGRKIYIEELQSLKDQLHASIDLGYQPIGTYFARLATLNAPPRVTMFTIKR